MTIYEHFGRIVFYLIAVLEATYGRYPEWLGHLSIDNGTDVSCAVVLIRVPLRPLVLEGTEFALTSAKCLTKYPEWEKIKFRVVLTGAFGYKKQNTSVGVERAIIHEKYDYRDELNQAQPELLAQFNIALLKLESGEHVSFDMPIGIEESKKDCYFYSKKSKSSIHATTMTKVYPYKVWQDIGGTFIYVANEGGKTYEQSFAGPLVCTEEGREVLKGLHLDTRSKTSSYVNLQRLSSWIENAVKMIAQKTNFADVVDRYATNAHNFSEVARKQLLYLLEGSFGYVPTNFLEEYAISRDEIIRMTNGLDRYLYKVKSILNRFGIGDIRGYVKTNNAYDCVAICLQLNSEGLCNFMPSLERCYIVDRPYDFRYNLDIPHNQSMIIYTYETKFHWPTGIADMTRSSEHEDYGAKWNVSLSSTAWPSFHCLGALFGTGPRYYTHVAFSKACVQKIVLPKESSTMIHAILGSNIVQIKPKKINQNNDAHEFPIDIVPIPQNYPRNYGHIMGNSPLLKSYSPWSGAYIMAPGTMPWIVELRDTGETCMGVLINKWSIGKQSQMGNEAQYVLTTARCAKKLSETHREQVYAGSYFLKKDSTTKQSTFIIKAHVHEGFTMGRKTVNDIAILELGESISLNPAAKCVKLLTAPPFSNYSIGTWNVEGGDELRPLYDIPVRAMVNGDGTFSTEKQSDKGIRRRQPLTDSILVGYKRDTGEPQLFGFHSGRFRDRGKYEDFYDDIRKYSGWIASKLQN